MTRVIWVLALLAGCLGGQPPGPKWRATSATSVELDERPHMFVIITGEAYELIATSRDAVGLHGEVIRAWTIPPSGSFKVRDEETPEHLAWRLEWKPHARTGRIVIPLDMILHAEILRTEPRLPGIAFGLGAIAGLFLFVALAAEAAGS